MKFKVWRSGKDGSGGRYETYDVQTTPGMSILDALFSIRDEQDDSLAFRYSCRGAVCGSCAMTINREPRLACRTQAGDLEKMKSLNLRPFKNLERSQPGRGPEVLIEPLPNMPVLKDLIVDMSRFYDHYKQVRPWMESLQRASRFSRMKPEEVAKVEKLGNCILCACCYGACPVCERDPEYLGPAALSWSLRFVDDPRAEERPARLTLVKTDKGVPDCEFIYNCVKVCPKGVAPAGAIRELKDHLRKV